MESTVRVRPAEPDDAARLLAWRNEPGTVATSLTGTSIEPDEHARWFARVLGDPDRLLLIGETADGTPIGMCRFDVDGNRAEVSINLDPAHRGRGLAGMLLHTAIAALPARSPQVDTLLAQVRVDNQASVRLFTAARFVAGREANGVRRFERPLRDAPISGTGPS